ncbi:uncharacterized protein LOC128858013 [Anastrepha ludens]|uniref:uncharacterized protein LOC128858013 n=1 Tax=Anastrepha ludens TaxID=28586 RepID=UPI0023B04313|nr:uncharacterized protein LOC128858013 [Anastrepha ludens]
MICESITFDVKFWQHYQKHHVRSVKNKLASKIFCLPKSEKYQLSNCNSVANSHQYSSIAAFITCREQALRLIMKSKKDSPRSFISLLPQMVCLTLASQPMRMASLLNEDMTKLFC